MKPSNKREGGSVEHAAIIKPADN